MTPSETPAIVVGSGKGGVGKSIVSLLLATTFARQGRRVLLLDGDQNLGNLHILLGAHPVAPLVSLLYGEIAPAELVQAVAPNLWFVSGDSGSESLYALDAHDRARLHHRLSALYDDFEAVIVDGGSGLESVVRASAMRATRLLVVTAPEPTALTDAYALVKTVHFQVPDLPIDVLVNRCTTTEEGRQAGARLAAATERLLGREIRYIGAVPEDPVLRAAARAPSPGNQLEAMQATAAAAAIIAMGPALLEPRALSADIV